MEIFFPNKEIYRKTCASAGAAFFLAEGLKDHGQSRKIDAHKNIVVVLVVVMFV